MMDEATFVDETGSSSNRGTPTHEGASVDAAAIAERIEEKTSNMRYENLFYKYKMLKLDYDHQQEQQQERQQQQELIQQQLQDLQAQNQQ